MSETTSTRIMQAGGDAGDGSVFPTPVVILDAEGGTTTPGGGSAAPATPTVAGVVRQAAYVPDPAGAAPTKAEFTALRDALVASGAMAPRNTIKSVAIQTA